MSSTTGLIFSYALGAIFALGGIAFMLFLDTNRYLFGVTYLVMGLALLYGVHASQRRRAARAAREVSDDEEPQQPS